VEYRFACAYFQIIVDGFKRSLHGEFYACSAGIGESILKTRNVEKTKNNNHIKWLKLSQQKLFFRFFQVGCYI